MDDYIDDAVDDILSQLSNSKKDCTSIVKNKGYDKITKDKLEDFVIEKSADLVQRALDIVDEIKDRACAGGDPEEIKSLADVLKATSSAVDALNKIHISTERNRTAKEINDKNIEAKRGMNLENNQTKLMLTRQEAMKRLFDKSDAIDAEIVEDNQSNDISTALTSSVSSNAGSRLSSTSLGDNELDSKLGNSGIGVPDESVGTESPVSRLVEVDILDDVVGSYTPGKTN